MPAKSLWGISNVLSMPVVRSKTAEADVRHSCTGNSCECVSIFRRTARHHSTVVNRLGPEYDSSSVRKLHHEHFKRVGMEKLCGYQCSMPNCTNRIRTDLVRIGESSILPGERGLFANSAIPKDTPIADFGPVR